MPADLEVMLRHAVESAFGSNQQEVTISAATRVEISGLEAYRMTVLEKDHARGSGTFVMLLKNRVLIQCFGVYDARFRETVERAIESIRFN